ncbi:MULTISPECIES: flagellar hook-length control protein FliK [unclassified Pseudomonas]|uniref:flagellar hook-length control protein FliK n=1 Tax=unclassified Pseudomonas TaxID=196821 RepID=UPI002A367C0C|nr:MULTISPECIES: flagellar hook-length control protein FliK [unclassified Pseudomonas]MDX9673521.1 flagellar hook-length control protein FliK [Pseudomonas sp. P8_250]WPN37946.1 flagellar hook-length control protein FliK [Pseudomonas sp. P8_139]WPN40251.1 flagellar hook-length control protein FliK [Pseudomonas sp. P8_229]
MPATPNILLQSAAQAKAQAAAAKAPAMAADTGDKASSFAQVFADQGPKKPLASPDNSLKPARDKVADTSDKKDVGKTQSAAAQQTVADSGNALPADKTASTASDDQTAADDAAADTAQTPVADTAAVDPALDPALAQTVQPLVTTPVAPTPVVETPAPTKTESPVVAATVAPAEIKDPAASTDSAFDPAADPLDSLPALRMAMEQGGHISAASQSQPKAAPAQTQADGELTSAQTFAAGMASMLDVQADKDSTSQNGEKAFSGLIDDGLKDLKSATSDTRVDDFANRLAALTQAATPKTANAVPVNQPIAMHQSGWTEEIVNRVMYLSSANLKAADIQLQPAELGRLDIRVNMVPDQQTQVTFMSAHPSVREALDGQMHRLRDMFTQQGMGQVDVNVSDQSRGWQGQQGQEQAQQGQSGRTSAAGGRLDSADEELAPAAVAEAAAQTTSVIGSSAVDYYA